MTRTLPAALVLALLPVSAAADGPAPLLPPDRPLEQAVDHYLDARLAAAKVQPAAAADDDALVRRLTLDLNGRIPTPAEVADYLASTDADKKVKLVERLLASPAFVRHQATEFATMLQPDTGENRRGARKDGLRNYLENAFAEGRPWDRVFRELLLPDDANPKTKGASDFLRGRVKDLNRLTIDVSTMFFGVNVSCAQCHDHPHVRDWKQDHFYGMKAFFARTFETGGRLGERDTGVVKFTPNKGKEKIARVMFLTGKVIDAPGMVDAPKGKKPARPAAGPKKAKEAKAPPPPKFSLRAKLVELALEPSQGDFFARSIVNRLWHRHFGRGLVMPLDQMHSANPASHPELLRWLARDLAGHGYDLRRLVRGLVLSNAYARGSRWENGEAPDEALFAVAPLRPLTPMQMAVSLRVATAEPAALAGSGPAFEKRMEALEKNAARLAGLFAQPGDNFQVGVGEAMLFTNNEALLKELLADVPGSLVRRLKQLDGPGPRAEQAVRSVLGRAARPEEVQALTEYLRRREDRPVAACQQVVWALLTSAEFRFNH